MHRTQIHTALFLASLLVAGCGRSGAKSTGELTAEWLGSDTGGLSVRPHAVWCERDSQLKVVAIRGDAGLGIALFPAGAIAVGHYAVFDPGVDSTRRPGVSFAARWVNDKAVSAFQSDSGGLDLTEGETGLAARFTVRLRGLGNTDTIRMTGHFGAVAPESCGPNPPPGPPRQ